ncbi:MAG: efflux RND transporter periplasmic adaptor subunit [Gammaproteobacteria bacterium]|nr:efflux RND transporter periplasmic adaptor subunit [Gammaproteobacteria bacterium]MBU0785539.1 efflux RND transporter periplasmic adaptor subunit [Gammaproteobacteria bacterium]MBU0816827.1 efflux RND transporter periplasmic adaptor subunit [Gammaproteobacteria bacterium]MBU1786991.1 efflux RND transporter periplasmic adaptor subunit [Gammaproteobacteria bacterium]
MKKSFLIGGLVVLALAAGGGWWWSQRGGADGVQYRTGKIERGALQSAVSATGAVSPVTQVTVGTQVSGQIKELLVDFNSEVKAGQLIAQIDPETFEYRVRSAQADVEAARAVVLTAQANSAASRAAVSRAQTDLTEAERTHERNLSLVEKGFIAQSEADRTRALVISSKEAVKAAQAQLGVTDAQIKSAQANVAQREAALAQSRIDLDRTRITSPVSGIVIKRAIEKGQTVAASLQSPELFIIAQNLREMQVEASIDEADVGRIRKGQKASFTVDAYPGQTFEGQIDQVRKAALNVANVVTYVAVVTFSNIDGRLLPGMTANVRVVTDQRESALKVLNAALRVRIAGVEPAPYAPENVASDAGPAGAAGQNGSEKPAAATAPTPTPAPGGAGRPGGQGGGAAAEFRNRMAGELKLTPEQLEKVDAIYASMRPRFMQLRDLPDAERGRARERITAEVRARIGELLTPEQKQRYAALAAESGGRTITRGRIYLLGEDGKPKAFNARLGITDGSSTELIVAPNSPEAAELKEGAAVITGTVAPGSPATPSRTGASGPRMMF